MYVDGNVVASAHVLFSIQVEKAGTNEIFFQNFETSSTWNQCLSIQRGISIRINNIETYEKLIVLQLCKIFITSLFHRIWLLPLEFLLVFKITLLQFEFILKNSNMNIQKFICPFFNLDICNLQPQKSKGIPWYLGLF